ncbi:MAG: hypothetical protein M5U34_14365 [Chloroflexi bacterium]|nr:hypothetical protein [Chloroflexota bacterium]
MLQILCWERLLTLEEEQPDPDWRSEALRQCRPFLYLKNGND